MLKFYAPSRSFLLLCLLALSAPFVVVFRAARHKGSDGTIYVGSDDGYVYAIQ